MLLFSEILKDGDSMEIFTKSILPIFVVSGLGYVVGKIFKGDVSLFSKVTMWIFSSVIIFTFVTENTPKPFDFLKTALLFLIIIFYNFVIFKVLIKDPTSRSIHFLTSIFGNTGYLGYPVIMLSFGEKTLSLAVLYTVVSTILVSTVGIALLSEKLKDGIKSLLKLPFLYSLIPALILGYLGVSWKDFPEPFSTSISMLKEAAIPVILVFMGVNMTRINARMEDLKTILTASIHRLLIVPLLAFFIVFIFKLDSPFSKIFLVESAMPSAVNCVIIASELRKKPEVVSGIVAFTTLLSALTLTLWIYIANLL